MRHESLLSRNTIACLLGLFWLLAGTGPGAATILPDPAFSAAAATTDSFAGTPGPPSAFSAAPGFHSRGPNAVVTDALVFDAGGGPALLVAGGFTAADEVLANHVARWTASGWSAFTAGTNARIWCMAVFDDGKGPALYAGGEFTSAGGVAANRVAKWDGASWSPLGAGTDGIVTDLAVFDDGTGPALYAGGLFLAAGGAPANRIAKWNGSAWSSLGAGVDGFVTGLYVFNAGGGSRLYVGGGFVNAGGAPAKRIASWDGSAWQALGEGMDASVGSFAAFDDGTGAALYAGGQFTTAGGAVARGIAKWNGSVWSALGTGIDGNVYGLGLWDSGSGPELYLGGSFNTAGGAPANRIAKWDGAAWSAVGSGGETYGTPFYWPTEFVPFDVGGGEKLFIFGDFDNLGGAGSRNAAIWDGATLSGATEGTGHGANAWVASLAQVDLGGGPALYMGGDFSGADDLAAPRIARWTGAGWAPLGSGLDGRVNAIAGFDDGAGLALFAGGQLETAGGVPAGLIAKWNGAQWSALGPGLSGPNGRRVYALAPFDDGSGSALFAGGIFSQAGGLPAANIARWNGAVWSAVGGGFNATVYTLAVFDAGDGPALYAGGAFQNDHGGTVDAMAKWNGVAWSPVAGFDASLPPGAASPQITYLMNFDDGSGAVLVAAGSYQAGAVSVPFLYRWDGAEWTSLGDDFVAKGLGVFDAEGGPALFAAGIFPGTPAGRQTLAKWGGSSWVDQGLDFDSDEATRMQSFDDGSGPALFVGGAFTVAGGLASTHIAKLRPTVLLSVPASTPVAEGGDVEVPVELQPFGNLLSAVAFSIDYDHGCLDPDLDNDNLLDAITSSVPGDFTTVVNLDPLDTDGEIDVTIADLSPPFAALPAGELLRIRYRAICSLGSTPADAALTFSASPAPSFGDLGADDVAGSSQGGVVHILPGPRGDCNRTGALTVSDLTAIVSEIFDGDGTFWLDAPSSSYEGSPVGCDANASTTILAADVTCANQLIFGASCSAPLAEAAAAAPVLEVSSSFDSGKVWLRGRLMRNGSAVGSLAYSLDLDPGVFELSQIDVNGDYVPDHLRFPSGTPGLAFVEFSASDSDGELDILLADLGQAPLAEGVLVEIGIPAAAAQTRGFDLAHDPAPSFGSVTGGDLPGIAVVGILLFTDGFESGDTVRWSIALP